MPNIIRTAVPSSVWAQDIPEGKDSILRSHHVVVDWPRGKQSFILYTEITQMQTAFVGIGMLGEVLFECQIQVNITTCQTIVNNISTKMFVEVMQLIYASREDLEAVLNKPHFSMQEIQGEYNGYQRSILYNNKQFVDISYTTQHPTLSDIVFENYKYSYIVQIRPLRGKEIAE